MAGIVQVGRQPIVDRTSTTVAYELLHRRGPDNRATIDHQDSATQDVIDAITSVWSLDELVGDRAAFVNVSNGFLAMGAYRDLPAARVVLELVENDDLGRATRAAMTANAAGYRLALDDVTEPLGLLGWPIAPLLDFVKVDVLEVSWSRLPALVHALRTLAPSAALVAEKVETPEMERRCRSLGFDLFQGYHLSMPEVLSRDVDA